MDAGKKKKTEPPGSSKLPKPPSILTQKPKFSPCTSIAATKLAPPKLPTPLHGSSQKPKTTPLTSLPEVKAPAHLATEFDLTRFLFKQSEIGERAAKEKTKPERTNKEKRELTKPEKILQFLTNPISKVYSLFLKRAIPIFDIGNQILQKEEPCSHILLPTLELQLEKLLLSFCKSEHAITVMNDIGKGIKPTSTRENQLLDEELSIGHDTRTFIQSQDDLELKPFFREVKKFFSSFIWEAMRYSPTFQ